MNRAMDRFRPGVSIVIGTLTLGLSVAVPLMERGRLVGETVLESEHDPTRCAHTHDHRICTLVGANLLLASTDTHHAPAHAVIRAAPSSDVSSTPRHSGRVGPPSRAPPSA